MEPIYLIMTQTYLVGSEPKEPKVTFTDFMDEGGNVLVFEEYDSAISKSKEIVDSIVESISGKVYVEVDKNDHDTFNIVSKTLFAKISIITLFDNM